MRDANQDFKEFVECLRSQHAEFLLIGAHALAAHGYPRFTGDLDVWVRTTPENLERVRLAIADFGFTVQSDGSSPWLGPNEVLQIGVYPNRIDVLATISGVRFEDAWETRVRWNFLGVEADFISKELLIQNKRASGRAKDLGDIEELEGRSS